MAAVVSVRMEATDGASKVIKNISKSLESLGIMPSLDVGDLGGSFVGFVKDVGATVWQLGELGAQSARVSDSFMVMAENAGISGTEMLAAMREATGGAISDTDLMLAANRAMMLGVGANAKEISKLMSAAIERGQVLGVSSKQAIDSIIEGIGKISPERLDDLGIVGVPAKMEAYAATLGTTADKLTDVQKKAALVKAVLDSSPSGGGFANDAALGYERLTASMQNAKEALGQLFAPATAAVANAVAQGLTTGVSAFTKGLVDANNAGVTDAGEKLGFAMGRAMAASAQSSFLNFDWGKLATDAALLVNPVTMPVKVNLVAIDVVKGAMEGAGSAFEKDAGPDVLPDKLRAAQAEYLRLADAITVVKANIEEFDKEGATNLSASGREGLTQLESELTNASIAVSILSQRIHGPLQGAVEQGQVAAWGAAASWDGFTVAVGSTGAATSTVDPQMLSLASKLGMVGAMALSATSNLEDFNAEVARLQGVIAGVKSSIDSGASSAQSYGMRIVEAGGDTATTAQMVNEAVTAIDALNLSYDGSAGSTLKNNVAIAAALQPLKNMATGLEDANSAAKKFASGGLSDMDKKFDDLKGKVKGVIDDAMNLKVDWPGKKGGDSAGGGDAVNENAKRLAAIANEGLTGQSWMEEFKNEAPGTYADLMLKIAEGMNPQGAAQKLMSEFQAGMRPELLDKDMIKDRVKQMLLGDANASALAQEIATELSQEMGVSMPDALSAAQTALGVTPKDGADGTGPDATGQGTSAGGTFQAGFIAGVASNDVALKILAGIDKGFKDNPDAITASGKAVGAAWGNNFMNTVGANIPSALIAVLKTLVTPAVWAQIQANQKLTTPNP